MTKKLISMLLSIAMVLSVAVVGISGVYAAIDNDDRYVPSEGTATKRLYFVMPESWKNEKFGADSAGIFWWNGSDACVFNGGSSQAAPWPGYKMQVYDADANIFYIDIPSDVPAIIFNNCLNGGEREEDAETGKVTFEFGEEQFKAAMQTKDVCCDYYSEGDSTYYDKLLDGEFWAKAQEAVEGNDKTFLGNFKDNFFIETEYDLGISMTFDNMIFVIDPENSDVNDLSGKVSYGGNFYFFYGKNADGKYEYGGLPNYEMAKDNGVVNVLDKDAKPATPIQPNKPQVPDDNNGGNNNGGNNNNGANNNGANNNGGNTNPTATVPAPDKNATSSADSVSTSDTTPTSDNGAVQTGVATAAAALAVVLIAGGAVLYTRKRFE